MLSKDTIKEKENPTNSKMIKSLSKFSATSPIPNTVAAKSVGIDIKKLNRHHRHIPQLKQIGSRPFGKMPSLSL